MGIRKPIDATAAKSANFKLRGQRDLREALERQMRRIPGQAKAALGNEAELQKGLAAERTPFLTGALHRSGVAGEGFQLGDDFVAKYGFGGAPDEIPYVFIQHYAHYRHDDGERKWLYNTAHRQSGRMLKRLAQDLQVKRI